MKTALRWALVLCGALLVTVLLLAPRNVGAAAAEGAAAQAGPAPEHPAPYCDSGGQVHSMSLAGGLLTVSPAPGALDAAPQTQISVIGAPAADISEVTVTGSSSGPHEGILEAYSQGDGASFLPSAPFTQGEIVSVHLDALVDGQQHEVSWSFHILERAQITRGGALTAQVHDADAHAAFAQESVVPSVPPQYFHSRPGLRPPAVEVTANRGVPRAGYIFMSPFPAGQAGPMILNDRGHVVWFHPVNVGSKPSSKATDLEVQHFRNEPVLTWWEDPLSGNGSAREPQDVIFNSAYEHVASVKAGNGFEATVHAFTITPQGTALLEAIRDVRCNLANVGGPPEGSLWDVAIQEIDIETGLVRWEWSSLDHVALGEGYVSAADASATDPYDFFHLNSIQVLRGNELLVSARNTWTIYRINQTSGQITFRLGGRHPSFKMGEGTETAFQHDAGALTMPGPNGRMLISVFDNGDAPQVHPQSEALIELVDLDDHTATRVRSFTHSPPLLAGSQGSVEVLENGDVVVGWGQQPWVSEYTSAGELIFDAHLGPEEHSYRALRYGWQGTPAQPPVASIERIGPGELAIYASWNGATALASWRVLEGASTHELSAVASAPRENFETRIEAPQYGTIVKVQALNAAGEVIGATGALTPGPAAG